MRRKLVPALYRLCLEGLLPEPFAVVGVARRNWDHATFRQRMRDAVEEFHGSFDAGCWARLEASMFYSTGNFNDHQTYADLAECLTEVEAQMATPAPRRRPDDRPNRRFGGR